MFETQKEKLYQAVQYLKEMDIDMWLIYTSEGSDPCIPLVTGVGTVGPGAFMVTKQGNKLAVCSSIDAQDIEQSELFDQVYKYKGSLAETLASIVQDIAPNTIALNISKEEHLADGLTTGRYRWLQHTLQSVFTGKYISSEPFLKLLRSIKSPAEVSKIKQAVDVTLDIYASVFDQLQAGMTEKQVGQLFIQEMQQNGVVNGVDRTLSMPIVMKENIAHRPPGNAVINKGDMVIMDFSVEIDGYVSDIARTVYFLKDNETEAPKEIGDAFQAVHQAISLAADKLKPGALGHEVDAAARNYYVESGYPEITHATGHQIGRDVHDGGALLAPRWERYGQSPYEEIQEGMVFTIEPTLFLEGGIHFIVEENVLVTKDGIDYLTKRQDNLILIKSVREEGVK
ncbi:M24 family metallopeptidase [Radiobacillus sp. PE A8.2]|uniref:M24 family metallopeptidase n=1 Tax=Radiobacillus sp. PE A8.2 TaxID=3380349 RepID=UPI00388D8862